MKLFVTLSALLAVASASHLYLAPGRLLAPSVVNQYHSQDGIGQYAFGYNDHLSSKQEVKSFDGTTRGSYSFIDANNALQSVDYIADAGGFRVAATNLPKPVEVPAVELPKQVADTFEVAAAKSAHLAAVEEAKRGVIAAPVILEQVTDTPEVAAAKAEHSDAINAAKYRLGSSSIEIPAPMGLPLQVLETPEVMKAKAEHFAAIEAAKMGAIELPRPIEDTPEVAKAKAEHLIAVEEAKLPFSTGKISLSQNIPLTVAQYPLSAYSWPSAGISTGVWDAPIQHSAQLIRAPIQSLAYNTLPLASTGYSYSTLNAPISQIRYASPYAYEW